MRLDGHAIAAEIIDELKKLPKPDKIFAAILVSDDPRSISFLKQKEQVAKELGVDFRLYKLGAELGNDGLRQEARRLVEKRSVGGAIIQLPLPEGINPAYILNAVPREKDIDVLGERALGAFYNNRNPVLPPAVETVKVIFEKMNLPLEGLKIAIVGRGTLVGKPISLWLARRCKELYLLGRNSDLAILSTCDVVISGVGKAGIIRADMLKEGAGVIDFGYSMSEGQSANGKLITSGDFDFTPLAISDSRLAFYTPTPGGTGPILVAKVFENFYKLRQVVKK